MVIDDSNTIRRSAEIFLKNAGYAVILAEDGFDALSKIADQHPHIIFIDIIIKKRPILICNLLWKDMKSCIGVTHENCDSCWCAPTVY